MGLSKKITPLRYLKEMEPEALEFSHYSKQEEYKTIV